MAPGGGRHLGGPNFRVFEDVALANAYKTTTLDAAVGTDQDGNTFWRKVADAYKIEMEKNQLVGGIGPGFKVRNGTSLQNRWNGKIQPALLKFSAKLMKAFSLFRSGWTLDDYYLEAKRLYFDSVMKEFMFELCWKVVEKLPKYEVDRSTMSSKVKSALDPDGYFDDDTDLLEDCDRKPRAMAVRPEIGQKAAKRIKVEQQAAKKKIVVSEAVKVLSPRDANLSRIAIAMEEKNRILQDSIAIDLFTRRDGTVPAEKFFALKTEEYLLKLELDVLNKKKELATANLLLLQEEPPLPPPHEGDKNSVDALPFENSSIEREENESINAVAAAAADDDILTGSLYL